MEEGKFTQETLKLKKKKYRKVAGGKLYFLLI